MNSRLIANFGNLEPIEILIEHDAFPYIYISKIFENSLVIAYCADGELENNACLYWVCTTTQSIIDDMKNGKIYFRDALEKGILFLVKKDSKNKVFSIENYNEWLWPEDEGPEPGINLFL
jgi:hypothetical protein